ncbi:MAG: hypothetical protein KIT84_15645 [Labilithrix sp.]|nr:hypothetical protein [Labilithrix sp.]MCW5812460.1 hypothetical protein [Labilithrix sp.]
MSDDVARAVRWIPDADGMGGRFRSRKSRARFHAFACLWNLLLPQLTSPKPISTTFLVAGLAGAALFAYFFVRALRNTTTVRFEGGRFACRVGPMPPGERFEHLLADIDTFAVEPTPDQEEWKIVLITRSGPRLHVPIDLDGIVVTLRGSNKALFGRAPRDHIELATTLLNDTLDQARRASSRYRVAGTEPPSAESEAPATSSLQSPEAEADKRSARHKG